MVLRSALLLALLSWLLAVSNTCAAEPEKPAHMRPRFCGSRMLGQEERDRVFWFRSFVFFSEGKA